MGTVSYGVIDRVRKKQENAWAIGGGDGRSKSKEPREEGKYVPAGEETEIFTVLY